MTLNSPYRETALKPPVRRIVVDLAPAFVDEVDAWGVPAGMRSRSDAIRALLRRGLEAEAASPK